MCWPHLAPNVKKYLWVRLRKHTLLSEESMWKNVEVLEIFQ